MNQHICIKNRCNMRYKHGKLVQIWNIMETDHLISSTHTFQISFRRGTTCYQTRLAGTFKEVFKLSHFCLITKHNNFMQSSHTSNNICEVRDNVSQVSQFFICISCLMFYSLRNFEGFLVGCVM